LAIRLERLRHTDGFAAEALNSTKNFLKLAHSSAGLGVLYAGAFHQQFVPADVAAISSIVWCARHKDRKSACRKQNHPTAANTLRPQGHALTRRGESDVRRV
jgi:hypothetical protein